MYERGSCPYSNALCTAADSSASTLPYPGRMRGGAASVTSAWPVSERMATEARWSRLGAAIAAACGGWRRG